MNNDKLIRARVNELVEIVPLYLDLCGNAILESVKLITETFRSGSKILICGNGGSAADSQHFAAEFVSSFSKNFERRALPALALTVDTSILTAFSNDFSFDKVFARQVEAYGKPGDLLILFSTSGESLNCILAAEEATEKSMKTIAFTRSGGRVGEITDISVGIPSTSTQHIQEFHMITYHIICELVENALFGDE